MTHGITDASLLSRRRCLLGAAALPAVWSLAPSAHAGGQLEEPLIDSVRTALSSAVSNQAAPVPIDATPRPTPQQSQIEFAT